MAVFGEYARYYDLIYKDKKYDEEVAYVDGLIRDCAPSASSLLDLGCGTGRHALEFSRRGYEVTGIDVSADMVALASRFLKENTGTGKTPVVYCDDVRNFSTGKTYDAVVSLFHVVSYLTTDTDLDDAFSSIKQHMHDSSVLIFDIWYGPAVLHQKPEKRVNHYSGDDIVITRTSLPGLNTAKEFVDVNYKLSVSGPAGTIDEVVETHRMRYFSGPQIRSILLRNGIDMLADYKWMSREVPDCESWSACIVARLS